MIGNIVPTVNTAFIISEHVQNITTKLSICHLHISEKNTCSEVKKKRKRGKPVQRKVLSKKNTPTGLLYLCASDIISHNFTVRCCSGSWIYLSQDHRHDSTMYHLSKHVGTVTIWPHRSRIIKTFIFYFLLSYGILKFQIIWCWSIAALSV